MFVVVIMLPLKIADDAFSNNSFHRKEDASFPSLFDAFEVSFELLAALLTYY